MRSFFIGALLIATSAASYGQADSLMNMLNEGSGSRKDYATATFKATRLINGSTVENLAYGVLDFRIEHRFGRLDQGSQNFWGIDNANTQINLDYGVTRWLMVGVAHGVLNKENQGFAKVKLLRQAKNGSPITLNYYGAVSVETMPAPQLPAGDNWHYSNRLCYANQILAARKFNESISLQIMPTLIHYNLVDSTKFSNNTIALGLGGRVKLNRRIAITGEYYYRLNNTDLLVDGQKTYNALSLGVDIETGGHVFQLMLTNCSGMTERTFVGQTTDQWGKGQLHFGFNISRVFTIVKPKEFRGSEEKW